MDTDDGFMGEVLEPAKPPEPPMCGECCCDLGGRLARVTEDGRLLCSGCDSTVPDE